MNKKEHFVITINRELGSGGRTVGEILAHRLGVSFYDKALIKAMEEKYNLTAEEIARDHVISGGYEDRSDNRGNYFNIFVPDCTCEDLNFLRLNCAVIDDPEQDGQILASLIDASRRGQTYCAFLIGEEAPFYTLTKKIADEYAGAWLHGTNRFLDGKPTIAENGSMVTYEDKRVIAFLITYV